MTDIDERTAAEIIADAEAEIAEADERVRALETAVEDGDDTVEFEHLEAARKQSSWAHRRRKGAEKKAAAAAQLERERTYAHLVEELIPRATADLSAREAELIEQVRPVLEELASLYADRNRALAAVAAYAADQANWRPAEDGLTGVYLPTAAGNSQFTFRGDTYQFQPPTNGLTAALARVRWRFINESAGLAAQWLHHVH